MTPSSKSQQLAQQALDNKRKERSRSIKRATANQPTLLALDHEIDRIREKLVLKGVNPGDKPHLANRFAMNEYLELLNKLGAPTKGPKAGREAQQAKRLAAYADRQEALAAAKRKPAQAPQEPESAYLLAKRFGCSVSSARQLGQAVLEARAVSRKQDVLADYQRDMHKQAQDQEAARLTGPTRTCTSSALLRWAKYSRLHQPTNCMSDYPRRSVAAGFRRQVLSRRSIYKSDDDAKEETNMAQADSFLIGVAWVGTNSTPTAYVDTSVDSLTTTLNAVSGVTSWCILRDWSGSITAKSRAGSAPYPF